MGEGDSFSADDVLNRAKRLNGLNGLNIFVSENRRRILHGLDNFCITGAAAEIAGKRIPNIVFGRVGVFIEQRFRHHQHAI